VDVDKIIRDAPSIRYFHPILLQNIALLILKNSLFHLELEEIAQELDKSF
jgi:hypothetical protein